MPEIWKDILDYEDCYQVSNLGRIQSKARVVPCKGGKTRVSPGKIRKLFLNEKGYVITTLSKENKLATFTVHQLVAQAFIPGFIKGMEINHDDGNKANNRDTNLEISNPSHNQFHAVRTGLKPKQGKSSQYRNVSYIENPRAKSKWAGCIRHAGKNCYGWKTFMTEEEAARHVDALLDSIGDTQRLRNFP
jgi:hypothetical protein